MYAIRSYYGVVLLSLFFLFDNGARYIGLIGLIPLVTAFRNNFVQHTLYEVIRYLLCIGTYTGSGSKGIYGISFRPETGEAKEAYVMAETENPSYLRITSYNVCYTKLVRL